MNKRSKIKTNIENYGYIVFFLFPIIDFVTSLFAWQGINVWIGSIVKGILLIIALLYLGTKKKNWPFLILLGLYILADLSYVGIMHLKVIENLSLLLKIFFLPICALFFHESNMKIPTSFLVKICFIYLGLLIIPSFLGIGHNISEIYPNKEAYLSFFYSGNELSGTLLCLMPITFSYLKKHHNWLLMILGFTMFLYAIILLKTKTLVLGLILTIMYFFLQKKARQKLLIGIPIIVIISIGLGFVLSKNFKVALDYYEINEIQEVFSIKFVDKVLLSSRLTYVKDVHTIMMNAPLQEKIFGLGDVSIHTPKNTEIDFFDITYSLGILGIITYLILFIMLVKRLKLKKIARFSFWLTILASIFAGHILNSAMVSLWLALVINVQEEEKTKKILMVSNMYPSKKAKHYGAFVKNMQEDLESLNYKVSMVKITKHRSKVMKMIAYSYLYGKTLLLGFFGTYDAFYVHYISHTALPAYLAHIFTRRTKFILNAHGNDVVKDYNFEEKNIKKSRFFIKKASLLVVPSHYFKKRIEKDYHYPAEKIIIYPSGGVDVQKFYNIPTNEARQKLKLDLHTFYIGYVSRIEKNKGYDTLLEALYLLKNEDWFKNTKVIMIGTGNEEEICNKLIRKYHLEDTIIKKDFVFQEELVTYYNAFDLFVFPTKRESESLGLVGLEAMACETFVIGCDLYGPSEYLVNQYNSLTYNQTKTGKALAQKIKEYRNLSIHDKVKIIANAKKTADTFGKENAKEILKKIFGEEI